MNKARMILCILALVVLLSGCGRETRTVVEYLGPVETAQPNPDAPTRSAPTAEGETFILNTSSVKFHRPSCAWAQKIKEERRIEWTGDRETLLEVGYKPCSVCKP